MTRGSTHNSMSQRLSEKEKYLLEFLQGTNQSNLLQLGQESQTRSYGELAVLSQETLAQDICRYLRIDQSLAG